MKWFKHNQQSHIPTGVNPKDGCQVEFLNKNKFIGAASSITWSSVLKYRVINKFIPPIEKPMNNDNKIVSATWIKHTGKSCPVDQDTKVEAMLSNGQSIIEKAKGIDWSKNEMMHEVIKYRVVKEFVKSSDLIASIDTPRMKDNRIERILAAAYVTFGEIETIVTLRMIKPELSLMTAKVTVEKYFPTKEYGRYLLNKILEERSKETVKATPVDL